MAISQLQLHQIAEAGRTVLNAFEGHVHEFNRLLEMFYRNDIKSSELLHALELQRILPEATLAKSRAILAEEAAHWRATARKNLREQRYRAVVKPLSPEPLQPTTFAEADIAKKDFPPPPVAKLPRAFGPEDKALFEKAALEQELIEWAQTQLRAGNDPNEDLVFKGYEYIGNEAHGNVKPLPGGPVRGASRYGTTPAFREPKAAKAAPKPSELAPGEFRATVEETIDDWGSPDTEPPKIIEVRGTSDE